MDNTTPTAKTPSRTPNRRPINGDPLSSRRSVHTPLDRSGPRELRNSIRRTPGSAGQRNNAPTPHAKAARRALNQRRTAIFTPGKNRRRSLMQQRETPLGLLRTLGKLLAPASQSVSSSSSSPDEKSKFEPIQEDQDDDELDYDDDDDDEPISRPELTLPIEISDDADSDEDLRPPRLSGIEDENFTVGSIELPRRFDQTGSRLSRSSFGSVRVSDAFNELSDDIGQVSDFFPGLLEDIQAQAGEDDSALERFDADQTRPLTMGRESDFGLEIPDGVGEQTTFLMSEPAADIAPTSPIIEHSVAEAMGAEERAEADGDVALADSDSDMGGFGFEEGGFDFDAGGVDDHSSIIEDEPTRAEPESFRAEPESFRVDPEPYGTAEAVAKAKASLKARRKKKRISRHGIEYPALPPSFVKRVAQTALQSSGLSNQRISPDTLEALTQASEWFFEQLGDDLGAYADHAKRKTIEESDVVTLMKRYVTGIGSLIYFSRC
ncbi:centromere kinetochore component CENP-T-domain-containing protein [Dactylonectria macrodidyma]|uniref:Centromere kinetochore component CENP-T-domain-containing protein n=1 Tax=Dactylonectria macrodidyma TaxID=307937 RepID=A0A9P9FU94_9HYPO|nr:centromere kinetochore component CENP-T-domain-containing protein [Dactylonectria macrodidyma]